MSSLFTHKNDNCQHITVGRKLRKEIVNSNICHWLNPVFNSVTNLLGELKKFEFSCLQSKIRREEGNKFSGKTSNIFFSYYKLRLQDYHTQHLENINEKARTWDVRWLVNGTMDSFSLPSSFPTSHQFSSVQLLSGVQLYVTPWTIQHARLPCQSPSPRVYANTCPLSRWCHPIIWSSVVPFSSCLQSFPASGSFQMSQFFASGRQMLEFQLQHQSFKWIFRTEYPIIPCLSVIRIFSFS